MNVIVIPKTAGVQSMGTLRDNQGNRIVIIRLDDGTSVELPENVARSVSRIVNEWDSRGPG